MRAGPRVTMPETVSVAMAERAGEERLVGSGGSHDDQVAVVGDPAGLGQVQQLGAVAAAGAGEVDLFDGDTFGAASRGTVL